MKNLKSLAYSDLILQATITPEGQVEDANKFFNTLYPDSVGRSVYSLIYPGSKYRLLKAYIQCKGEPNTLHLVQIKTRGVGHNPYWVSLEVYYCQDSNRYKLVGVLASMLDDLDTTREKYLRICLDSIAYLQSHWVRNHLARALGLSNLIAQEEDILEIKRFAAMIHQDLVRMDKNGEIIINVTQSYK